MELQKCLCIFVTQLQDTIFGKSIENFRKDLMKTFAKSVVNLIGKLNYLAMLIKLSAIRDYTPNFFKIRNASDYADFK